MLALAVGASILVSASAAASAESAESQLVGSGGVVDSASVRAASSSDSAPRLALSLTNKIAIAAESGIATRVPVSVDRTSEEVGGPSSEDVYGDLVVFDDATLTVDGIDVAGWLHFHTVNGSTEIHGSFGETALTVFSDRASSEATFVFEKVRSAGADVVFDDTTSDGPSAGDIEDIPRGDIGTDERPNDVLGADVGREDLVAVQPFITRQAQNPNSIDLLFIYDSLSGMSFSMFKSQLLNQVVDANQAMTNTGGGIIFNVVGYELVSSPNSNVPGTILNRVKDPNDGRVDEAHLLRDVYGADVVVIIDRFAALCGLATRHTSTSFTKYNHLGGYVLFNNTPGCLAGLFLPHELGHVFGGGHRAGDSGWFSDSAGFSSPSTYRTLISDLSGSKILWYSTQSPAIAYSGGAVGSSSRENDRAFFVFDDLLDRNRYSNRDYVDYATVYGSGGNKGYRVTSNGTVVGHGGAPFLGDVRGLTLAAPIVGIETDRDGHGYYLVASDGGVFAYSASFHGSAGGISLNEPIVDMATDADGSGYWLVAADGGVFAYSASFHGSMGGQALNEPIVAMDSQNNSSGYWLVGLDGGVFAFSAGFYGSAPVGSGIFRPARDIVATNDDDGYWIVSGHGRWRVFGGATPKSIWGKSDGDMVTGADAAGELNGSGGNDSKVGLVDRSGSRTSKS